MTKAELRALHEGDCIQSRLTGQNFLVTGNYGTHVTAVQTVDVTHADEWILVYTVTPQAPRKATP
jgi:hypothetical protein